MSFKKEIIAPFAATALTNNYRMHPESPVVVSGKPHQQIGSTANYRQNSV